MPCLFSLFSWQKATQSFILPSITRNLRFACYSDPHICVFLCNRWVDSTFHPSGRELDKRNYPADITATAKGWQKSKTSLLLFPYTRSASILWRFLSHFVSVPCVTFVSFKTQFSASLFFNQRHETKRHRHSHTHISSQMKEKTIDRRLTGKFADRPVTGRICGCLIVLRLSFDSLLVTFRTTYHSSLWSSMTRISKKFNWRPAFLTGLAITSW